MTTSTKVERLAVRSPDGVELAVWVEGRGPAIVLVHGSIQDHTVLAALVAELRTDFTTYSMDRRGFGASGDGATYSLELEFADVAAVVDEVAARTGRPVVLWGHSFGASCAMGAAELTRNVGHLVLYEPSLGLRYPVGWVDRVEQAVAAGDHETAVVMLFRDLLDFTDEQVEELRAGPEWAGRVETAPTIAREARAEQRWEYLPGGMNRIAARSLLLSGSGSTPDIQDATEMARDAIPGAQVRVLEGHAHIAHRTDPALVAAIIREYVTR
ncbi:alpha/beta hydrolase [Nocardioides koreensis]|uniref:Alpha/beta hydrolase n=1 Tax=Nocardioides koreensis TaxID=433651 RepID=A0ABN2ZS21_9ACTN